MLVKRLLVVADHPGSDRGFATVGRHVAEMLQASGEWEVHYLTRFEPDNSRQFGFALYSSRRASTGEEDEGLMFPLLAAQLSRNLPPGQRVLPVLMIGSEWQQAVLLRAALTAGVRRRLVVAAYVPVDYAPFPSAFARFVRAVDVVIPYTRMGQRAIERCCVRAGVVLARPMRPIPHGVDPTVFRPLSPAARVRARAKYFHVQQRALVIGVFGRNVRHKRIDLALRIFRIFAQGWYVDCRACGLSTVDDFDPVSYGYSPAGCCRHCRSTAVSRARGVPSARLYLHTEVLEESSRAESGGWDVVGLIEMMELGSQVVLHRSLRIGAGVPIGELAERMGACDIHFLPYEGGGWELTVLETGACGVPNVITDVGAPPEYARSFSVLVRVGAYDTQGEGDVRGLIDEEAALTALRRLARSSADRRRLGAAGVVAAAAHSWSEVGALWLSALGDLDLTRRTQRTSLSAVSPLIARSQVLALMTEPWNRD